MSSAAGRFPPRRILVAVDGSRPSLLAVRAAGDLAARLGSELLGLFVEDIELLRLARLEVASHVSLSSASGERLDTESLQAQLAGLAERARRAVGEAASRGRVEGHFRIARGVVVAELVQAALEADLLVMGWSSRPPWPRQRLGRTAQAAAERTACPALVLPEGARIDGPVAVVVDAAAGADAAIEIAARIAAATRERLSVIVPAPGVEASRERIERVRAQLAGRRLDWEPIPLADGAPVRLRHALRQHRGSLIVIGGDSELLRDEGVRQLIEELGCALLLAR